MAENPLQNRGSRIRARFHPQAWAQGYAVNVDPQGESEFDVTDAVVSLGRDKALALKDDTFDTDTLKHVRNAPAWVHRWSGPFYVEVEQSVHDYFERNGGPNDKR